MNRRVMLRVAIGIASIYLSAGSTITQAQQADIYKIKMTRETLHAALSSLDISKMDEIWAHDAYVMLINPRDKTVTTGWDAVRKNWETTIGFWSELKVTSQGEPRIHINGNVGWANGIASVS